MRYRGWFKRWRTDRRGSEDRVESEAQPGSVFSRRLLQTSPQRKLREERRSTEVEAAGRSAGSPWSHGLF